MDFSLMNYNYNYDHNLKKLLSVDTIMCGVHGLGWKKANKWMHQSVAKQHALSQQYPR